MFEKSKMNKNEEKFALKIMEDFIEGRLPTEEFWNEYKNNSCIQDMLVNDKTRPLGAYLFDVDTKKVVYNKNVPMDSKYYYAPERLIQVIDITKLEHKNEIFQIVKKYFERRKKKLNFFNKDAEDYSFLLKMLPEWLDIRDETFLTNILNSAPKELSKTEKLQYCKEKIKEIFKCDSKSPEWVQNPEWPIVDGKPLVFNHQEVDIDSGYTYFYFYDEETKAETVIEQYD